MTLVTCAALAIIFPEQQGDSRFHAKHTEKAVQESLEDVEWEDGAFDLDSDFYDLDGGVYLSLYTESGNLLYGRIPYGFDLHPEFLRRGAPDSLGFRTAVVCFRSVPPDPRIRSCLCPGHFLCDGGRVQFPDYTSVCGYRTPASRRADCVDRVLFYKKNTPSGPPNQQRPYRRFRLNTIFPAVSNLGAERMKSISWPVPLTIC